MTNITRLPAVDGFQTTLAQAWNGAVGTVFLNDTPAITLGSNTTCIVVDPGKSNMQVAEINAIDTALDTVTVSDINIASGLGTTYSQQSHTVGATVIVSDNFQFWKDIQTAVNSKSNIISPEFSTSMKVPIYASLADLQTAYPTPANGLETYCTLEGQFYDSVGGSWQPRVSGTNPNASTTTAGKVEIPTNAQFYAGTDTGETGALMSVLPSQAQAIIHGATAKTTPVDADELLLSDSAASFAQKKITFSNLQTAIIGNTAKFGGSGADGAVDGTAGITITGSNNTYIVKNYSSWAAGSAPRTITITPTNCIVHIKIKGNADFSNWTFDFRGKGGPGGVGSSTGTPTAGTASLILTQSAANTGGGVGTIGAGGGGGASSATNGNAGIGGTGGGTPGTAGAKNRVFPLTVIQSRRCFEMSTGAGGAGGVGDSGGNGGAGGGCVIIEVFGTLTLDNSTTVFDFRGSDGTSTVTGNSGGGGGGGGGTLILLYNGTLTGTNTPNVAAGAGGTKSGTGGNGGAGGNGDYIIEQNAVFA